jgi:hypothetical protein
MASYLLRKMSLIEFFNLHFESRSATRWGCRLSNVVFSTQNVLLFCVDIDTNITILVAKTLTTTRFDLYSSSSGYCKCQEAFWCSALMLMYCGVCDVGVCAFRVAFFVLVCSWLLLHFSTTRRYHKRRQLFTHNCKKLKTERNPRKSPLQIQCNAIQYNPVQRITKQCHITM